MWWTIVPSVLVTLAVVLIPGFAFNWAAGLRPRTALGLAPLSSVGLVSGGAVIGGFLGLEWGPLPVIAFTAFATLIAWGLRILVGKRWPALCRQPDEPPLIHWGWLLGSGVVAAALMVFDSVRALGSPSNFSQTYDNVFHLNLVQWMVQHRTGSVLELTMTGDEAFYPAAWHDLASLVLLILRQHDAMLATNALIIVTMAVIWPFSCLTLVARALPLSRTGTLGTAVLLASFGAFPYWLIRFGVLYPNFLALCLLPAVIALEISLLDLGEGQRFPLLPTLLAGAAGVATITLAHPNATVTLICVLSVVFIFFWALNPVLRGPRLNPLLPALRISQGRTVLVRMLLFAGWVVVAAFAFKVLRPPWSASVWGPAGTFGEAISEAITSSPLVQVILWPASILVLVGAVAVIVTRRLWWLLGAHLGLSALWIVGGALEAGKLRYLLVGPWYNDPNRLAAMLPITAIPLAAYGLAWISDLVQRLVGRQRTVSERVDGIFAVLVTTALLLTTQWSAGKLEILDGVRATYEITPDSVLVDSDEFAVIQMVEELTDPDDVIAVNPWTGASMAYALTGRQTTAVHVTDPPDKDTQILIDHLSAASDDPEVCPAINDLSVDWVLDFGNERFINNEDRVYPGWYGLEDNPGFELAFRQGEAALYRVIACD